MELNIPIYRAKKIDSDDYVEGFLYQDIICYIPSDGVRADEYKKALDEESWFITDNMSRNEMIDITTLSIHFPNMLDVEDDKIFASLQEFGKSGDVITDGEYDFVVIFNGRGFDLMFVEDNTFTKFNEWDDWNKFTKKGIQQ